MLGDRLSRYLVSRHGVADSQDILQDVFARLVRYHKRLAKAKNLTAYVFLMARNESSRWAKKNKKNHTSHLSDPIDKMSHAKEVVDPNVPGITQFENRELVQRLLDELTDESREIVLLKIYSGLTFAEVAKILGIPDATAATKYRRAILQLQDLVADSDETEMNQFNPTNLKTS